MRECDDQYVGRRGVAVVSTRAVADVSADICTPISETTTIVQTAEKPDAYDSWGVGLNMDGGYSSANGIPLQTPQGLESA